MNSRVINISRKYSDGEHQFEILFLVGDDVFGCATEAGIHYGKRPSWYLRTARAQNYANVVLEDLRSVHNHTDLTLDDLVYTITTGPNKGRGTWMQRDIFIDYAQWLDPKFALWCNRQLMDFQRQKEVYKSNRVVRQLDVRVQKDSRNASMAQIKRDNPDANKFTYAARCDNLNVAVTGHRSKYWRRLAEREGYPKKYCRNAQEFFRNHSSYHAYASAIGMGHDLYHLAAQKDRLDDQMEKAILSSAKKAAPFYQELIEEGVYDLLAEPMTITLDGSKRKQLEPPAKKQDEYQLLLF